MKEIRIGIFGAWRGSSFIDIISLFDGVRLTAICDNDETKIEAIKAKYGEAFAYYADFDSFLASGLDAVFLCNYFHEHAACAIKAMKRGIHVFSECTSAATLAECVELVEAYEASGCKYMIAENYPFSAANMELTRICEGGTLGGIMYAEGEYNHSADAEGLHSLTPGKYHWRAWLPRAYYITHAFGPIMYAAKTLPKKVNARAVHSDLLAEMDFRKNWDCLAMMFCVMDNGALFRVTGCTAMPSPSGYRIVGEKGSVESGRSLGDSVMVNYHSWLAPVGVESRRIYKPEFEKDGELAINAGHGGGDYWTVRNFVRYLKYDEKPFFDVYCGVAMSATAILGWYSCLNDGATYDIPDFRIPAERDRVRSDRNTPFPDENGLGATLPAHIPY